MNMKKQLKNSVIKCICRFTVLLTVASFVRFESVAQSMTDNNSGYGWALARVSVACVREKPGHAAELGTQLIMGTPVKLIGREGGWWKVEAPDGYVGYVIDNSLTPLSDASMERWKNSHRGVVVSGDQAYVYDNCGSSPMGRVTDVVNGSILTVGGSLNGDFVEVELPDGRKGVIASSAIADLEQWASEPCDMDSLVAFACRHMGVPYLWGGTSSKSMDCSGLTKIAYLSQGVILPRNASQQAVIGKPVASINQMQPGDLLCFGNRRSGKVNHVGIYIGNGRFVHSSGFVRISSLMPDQDDYESVYLITTRHLSVADLQKMALKNHSWFFN